MTTLGSFKVNSPGIVSVISKNPLKQALFSRNFADVLEIRFDKICESILKSKKLIQEIKVNTGLPCIVTNRSHEEGGNFEGSEKERVKFLIELIPFADAVDIELSTDKVLRNEVIKCAKENGLSVIISSHDFLNTPDIEIMKAILNKSFKEGADIAKIAVMPNSIKDVLNLLAVTLDMKEVGSVCTISMGEIGKHSRIIASLYGSVLTYGTPDNAVAPGQYNIKELRALHSMIR